MGHQTKKLTLTQKIAITWLKNIDSNLLLFNTLKSINQGLRVFFYVGLVTFTSLAMMFIMSFVDFSTFQFSNLLTLLVQIICYGVIIGISLVFTIESVIKLDVAQIFQEQKDKKEYIKAQKLQFWRLRNMNLFVRILVYISFYLFCVFIIQIASMGAFIEIFAATSAADAEKQIALFIQSYESFLQWFTFIYLTAALMLDYFVNKKIRALKAQKEVQNETVAH